jgi:hypothetical protein
MTVPEQHESLDLLVGGIERGDEGVERGGGQVLGFWRTPWKAAHLMNAISSNGQN